MTGGPGARNCGVLTSCQSVLPECGDTTHGVCEPVRGWALPHTMHHGHARATTPWEVLKLGC